MTLKNKLEKLEAFMPVSIGLRPDLSALSIEELRFLQTHLNQDAELPPDLEKELEVILDKISWIGG